MWGKFGLTILLLLVVSGSAWADGEGGKNLALTRAEVKELKTLLTDLVAAIGQPPAGYVRLEENFNLPTDYRVHGSGGRFYPLSPGLRLKFGTDLKAAGKSSETAEQDLQRKFLEANAKGDYQAMMGYQQEMSALGLQKMNTDAAAKNPIAISLQVNNYRDSAIDPDGVIFEKKGLIALKEPAESGLAHIVIYFDPVALKQTETLSRVELPYPDDGVKAKNTISNVIIEFEGPEAEVASWAGQVNTAAVLGKIK